MQAMTRKELSNLTMKQIREYCVMKGAKKVPKKWQDKTTALDWVDKNLNVKPEVKKEQPKAEKPKVKKEKSDNRAAIQRRVKMTEMLRQSPCVALELKDKFGNEYKSILDDLHAIRHNRNGFEYLDEDEILIGVFVGRVKVFQIVKKSKAEKAAEQIKTEIQVIE
jgi:hypothetical protein